LQGAAGGGLQPSGTSLIGHVYGDGRMRAIGFYSSLMPFGAVLGPVVGGLIVDHFGWRWTFGFNAPLGLLVGAVAVLLLPQADRRDDAAPIDYPGIGLIAVGITSLIFALTELGRTGATPDYRLVAATGVMSVTALLTLLWHERRTASPIIDLDLLSRREFAATNAMSFSFGMSWIGVASTIPLYAQKAYGMSTAVSGAILSPRAAVMVFASMIAAYFLPRTGFRKPILIGMLGLVVTLFIIGRGLHEPSLLGVTIPNFWWLLAIVGLAGVFFGMANPSMTNAGIELAPDRIAAITGLRGMFMNLGGTIGISFVLLVASRAGDVGQGLDTAFTALAVILLCTMFVVPVIPEMGQGARTAAGVEARGEQLELEGADRA
jgi:MFS family permease